MPNCDANFPWENIPPVMQDSGGSHVSKGSLCISLHNPALSQPSWPTPLGMMDLPTLPQSPLLMSKPVPGSSGLGQEDLDLQTHGKLSPLLDDGLTCHDGVRLQPETVSSPLALGHSCQTPHCPPCIGKPGDGQTGHSEVKRGMTVRSWDPTACPSGVVRLSLLTWRYHRNP